MTVTVQPDRHADPSADVLTLENGESFAVVKFGADATVILPGRDLDAIDYIADLMETLRLASKSIVRKRLARQRKRRQ